MAAAELIGLPRDWIDPVTQVAYLRYLLLVLALAWGYVTLRARPSLSLACGWIFICVAVGYWILSLGRPYGLLIEADITRHAARLAATATGVADAAAFLGDGVAASWRSPLVWIVRMGVAPLDVLALSDWLPMLALLATSGCLFYFRRSRGDEALLGALAWLAFSTGDMDTLRGFGFVSAGWRHADAALLFLLLVPAWLLLERLRTAGLFVGSVFLIALAALCAPAPLSLSAIAALRLITFDQGLWAVLGAIGLWRGRDRLARTLAASGATLLLGCGVWPPLCDAWLAHALLRLGLILAASAPLLSMAEKAGMYVQSRVRWLAAAAPRRIGIAALIISAAPSSFVANWDAIRLDPTLLASAERLSSRLTRAMTWIAQNTPQDAVFAASPAYAPTVAILGGRQVLRAPTLAVARDDERRTRLTQTLIRNKPWGRAAEHYRLMYLFLTPGDFGELGLQGPEQMAGRPGLREVYRDEEGYRVFALDPRQAPIPGLQ
ncbi:MAG: hypothetical protein MUF51_01545 [Vicinamibacteria bacterium]|jgi:hypothetical protein|nr:hypothetical protein [Vicinamibacteria bacterium]